MVTFLLARNTSSSNEQRAGQPPRGERPLLLSGVFFFGTKIYCYFGNLLVSVIMSSITEFGRYLKTTGTAPRDAAKALSTTRAYIYMLSIGTATPALKLAGEIEKWSKGKVRMQTWLKWISR